MPRPEISATGSKNEKKTVSLSSGVDIYIYIDIYILYIHIRTHIYTDIYI